MYIDTHIHTSLAYFILTTCQFNSQSLGRPGKRKGISRGNSKGNPWNKLIEGAMTFS